MDSLRAAFLVVAGLLIIFFLAGMVINTWLDVAPRVTRFREARQARKLMKHG